MSTTLPDLVQIAPLPPSSHAYSPDNFDQAGELEAALRQAVTGDVQFDRGTRALYATDASNYRHIPIGVVLPRTREDVIAAVAVCRSFGAPLLSRGAGTSLAGQCTNVAVILDFSRYMHHVLEVDADAGWVRVEPGIVLDALQAVVKPLGWFFAPDPATHSHCTLGGMLGNNSCGSHALFGGKTDDNTLELEVLLYDGTILTAGETNEAELARILAGRDRRAEIYQELLELRDQYGALVRERFPDIPRRVSGYNLNELLPERSFNVARALVGSEATCVVILSAKLRLKRNPSCRTLVVVGFPDIFVAADHVPAILEHQPIAVEGFDGKLVEFMRRKSMLLASIGLLPAGNGWLYVEFGADTEAESQERAAAFADSLVGGVAQALLIKPVREQRRLWEVREAALGATAFVPGQKPGWEGWEDHAVAPEKLGAYLRAFRALLDEFGYDTAFYGHFGQACVHVRIDFDLRSEAGIRHFRAFLDRAADLTVSFGGSLSGEHGDGQARGALLEKMYGSELMRAFERFKDLWDPAGKMNPGKLIRARQPHADLRYGADFAPAEPANLHFAYASDGGSFAHAAERCVGVGKCRKEVGGTMCPSYMATRDERHSTRGRAHALFEMLQGEVLGGGVGEALWDDEDVKETLELCLSCKACKSECPVNVDMATYKAEFMAHYHRMHRRPLRAYAFGFIDQWARLASWTSPEALNLLLRVPGVAFLAKALLGVAQQRAIPQFAARSYQSIRKSAGPMSAPGNRRGVRDVLLWPDTFNNYFQPQVSSAAQRVLESAGFRVHVPRGHVCCGRPLYDFGLLDQAKAYLQRTLDSIEAELDAGMPVVVLEPSCASVFRDELTEMLPGDPRAQRLRDQTYLLSEFLQKHAPDWQPPHWPVEVTVQGHCHHKALMKMSAEEEVLQRMGARATVLDSGCCGMAGPFGFEKENFDVSQALAERVLLPTVREAPMSTAVLADGFSCREAISQNASRHGVHLAELLDLASHPDRNTAAPEELARRPLLEERRRARVRLGVGAAVAAGVAVWFWRRR
ncbi:FAD-binding and (Fe-S)-binding domain-containing protein [Terriglobus aquaticus]|uniref:FAD-binding and (Fe-S)-binding domain-containing protein n=1 Tax=Terriglobus aquaticus TaxID=940139 RepID=A0ABW9KLY1_9BACT|nr:FAD-binding and (Fe-S)-binding domain-containing protein [Terriglobus aquaticus]